MKSFVFDLMVMSPAFILAALAAWFMHKEWKVATFVTGTLAALSLWVLWP